MKCSRDDFFRLNRELKKRAVVGYCPTTLSAPWNELLNAVRNLGGWTREAWTRPSAHLSEGAMPLGLHLEGPYLSSEACGAHPPESLRPFSLEELETLWIESQETVRLITLAPERIPPNQLTKLKNWAQKRKIRLSMGHSHATQKTAEKAIQSAGFQGVTHAWNALRFHQRDAGILGAALGRSDVFVELILDQLHVDPTVIRWTRKLHPSTATCFVSDCAPAAATKAGSWHSFGPLEVENRDGACRTRDSHLAGAALLLSDALRAWVEDEARFRQLPTQTVLKSEWPCASLAPLRSLQLPAAVRRRMEAELKIKR